MGCRWSNEHYLVPFNHGRLTAFGHMLGNHATMLKMNHDKTELIAIGTKPKISQVTFSLTPVSISGHDIPFSQSVRNLGVFIDETLSMNVHIKHLCHILFCQLCRLGKIAPSSPLMQPTNSLFLLYSQD